MSKAPRGTRPGYVWVRLADRAAGGSWQDPTNPDNYVAGYGAAELRKTKTVIRLLGQGGLVELPADHKLVDEAVERRKEDKARIKAKNDREASALGEANQRIDELSQANDEAKTALTLANDEIVDLRSRLEALEASKDIDPNDEGDGAGTENEDEGDGAGTENEDDNK